MGDFTSKYKDQDGRITTRIDTVKSIDSLATVFTYLLFGVFILLWKILKYIFFKKQDDKSVSTKDRMRGIKYFIYFILITISIFIIFLLITNSHIFR